jgi:flavin reductase (DIM6/NTAB) family NADH-FMN oxidoreductase RutF
MKSVAPGDVSVPKLYELMVSAVQPRPIALVTTIAPSGLVNIAPFSFFMLGGVNPVSLMFCPSAKGDGTDKATLANIETSREFVVNIADRAMADGVGRAGATSGGEKVTETGFSLAESSIVKPPRVAESPVQFECQLHSVIRHGQGPFASIYVIGEVVMIHALPSVFENPAVLNPIGRLGGPKYLDLNGPEIFEL